MFVSCVLQAISPGIVETEFRQRMYPDEDPMRANKLYQTMEEVLLSRTLHNLFDISHIR